MTEDLDSDAQRWRALAILAIAELLGMSLWFGATAVGSRLPSLGDAAAHGGGWLTTTVQLGFVVGTAVAAVLNLADLVPARRYFAISATCGAVVNAAVAFVPSPELVYAARFMTGFFLAGVYPPAMKMAATWFRARRGLAIGTVVGALTIGKATPYLIQAIPAASETAVILAVSVAALAAALIVGLLYRDGPYPFAARPFSWSMVRTVTSQREWRLITGGYLGHMFELYSFWTWIPAFLAASHLASGGHNASIISVLSFLTIAVGGAGCIWGGVAADRHGRRWLVTAALITSGSCAMLTPILFGRSTWLVAGLTMVWGFFVIADSAQFSALVTEAVPPHVVGTALTIQTSLGFLLTMVSIELVPAIVEETGWRWAFPVLALGPACGIALIRRLGERAALSPVR